MGRPPKAAPVFLITLYHKYVWIFLIYSLYIPYIFPSCVKYVFPCVFLNLWSQEKISPYSKTTFLLLFFHIMNICGNPSMFFIYSIYIYIHIYIYIYISWTSISTLCIRVCIYVHIYMYTMYLCHIQKYLYHIHKHLY